MESSFLEHLRRRREILAQPRQSEDSQIRDLARALADGSGLGELKQVKPRKEALDLKALSNEKVRIRANWDPVFPDEKVNWYDEYITRHAPISTSWLQQPRNRESPEREYLEVRGVALYTQPTDVESTFAVAPLDDGSLCLWDINGTRGRKGAIWQRSKPGILSVDPHAQAGPGRRSKMVSTGVTECISIDNFRNRAYVAVQSSTNPPAFPAFIYFVAVDGSFLYLICFLRSIDSHPSGRFEHILVPSTRAMQLMYSKPLSKSILRLFRP